MGNPRSSPTAPKSQQATDAVIEDSGSTVARWLASLMLVQVLSRGVHFALNLFVLRMMAPAAYGVSALQLPLVTMAATRILKEALHRLCVRGEQHSSGSSAELSASAINGRRAASTSETTALLWWGIVAGIAVSGALSWAFANTKDFQHDEWVLYALGCWLLSSWGELLSEPVIIQLERSMIVEPTVLVEGFALLGQSAVCIVGFIYPQLITAVPMDAGIVTALGQLAYGFLLCVGYWFVAFRKGWLNLLLPLKKASWKVTARSMSSATSFLVNSMGKYITAEGEAMILFTLGTEQQQGVYQFVANLGSIVARIFFLSIERTAFIMFADKQSDSSRHLQERRLAVWNVLMRVSVTIALLYLATCPPFIEQLVDLAYGSKWSQTEAPMLLSLFGFYLLAIAVNGLTEAYRDAVVPFPALQRQAWFTIFSTALYFIVGALAVTNFGALGLVLASCFNTSVRFAHSVLVFRRWIPSVRQALPGFSAWVVCSSACTIGFVSRSWLQSPSYVSHLLGRYGIYSHLVFGGGAIALGLLAWLAVFQVAELRAAWRIVKHKST